MNTSDQLTEALSSTAMTRAQEYALRDQLRRCVRCRNLDREESRCMVGECAGIFIEHAADHGCILFDD